MTSPTFLLTQALNSLSLAALLFFVAAGLTLIFGLMNVINLAHGSYYLLGGLIGHSTIQATGQFWVGVLAAAAATAAFGSATERVLMRRVRGEELPQVLLTLGVTLVVADLATVVWGGQMTMIRQPDFLGGVQWIGSLPYSRYRLFVIVCSIVLAAVLYYLHRRTRLGALIRAGVDDREMVAALGINIRRVFTLAFGFGTALAGVGGVIAGAVLGLQPGEEADILLLSLAVVIIGGVGRLDGTIIGCVLVGFITIFGRTYAPEFSYFILFGPMALILVFRPRGLLGRK